MGLRKSPLDDITIEGRPIEEVIADLENAQDILKIIAADAQAKADKAFLDQKRGKFNWPPRRVPNISGALADLASGQRIKSRRFDKAPALVDTGRLRASISAEPDSQGKTAIKFGSDVSYANIHQQGGASQQIITDDMRNRVKGKDAYSNLGAGQKQEMRARLTALVGSQLVKTTNVPARPFFLFTDQDKEEIIELLEAYAKDPSGTGAL